MNNFELEKLNLAPNVQILNFQVLISQVSIYLSVPFQLQSPYKYVNKGDQVLFQQQTNVIKCFFNHKQRWSSCVFFNHKNGWKVFSHPGTQAVLLCFLNHVCSSFLRFFNHKQRRSSAFSTTNNGGQALFK